MPGTTIKGLKPGHSARAEREELEAGFPKSGFQQTTDYFRAYYAILTDFDGFALLTASGKSGQQAPKSLAEQRNAHPDLHPASQQGVLAVFGQNWSKLLKMALFDPFSATFGHFSGPPRKTPILTTLVKIPTYGRHIGFAGSQKRSQNGRFLATFGLPGLVPDGPSLARSGPQNPQNRSFSALFDFSEILRKACQKQGNRPLLGPLFGPLFETSQKSPGRTNGVLRDPSKLAFS